MRCFTLMIIFQLHQGSVGIIWANQRLPGNLPTNTGLCVSPVFGKWPWVRGCTLLDVPLHHWEEHFQVICRNHCNNLVLNPRPRQGSRPFPKSCPCVQAARQAFSRKPGASFGCASDGSRPC